MDMSEDILKKSVKGIETSLKRVAKKKFAEKPAVSFHTVPFGQFSLQLLNAFWL